MKFTKDQISENNFLVKSEDGSYTAYSSLFSEHYHSTKDGALTESINKHIIPAFKTQLHKKEITILDICYGLGFNTLSTLYFVKKNSLKIKLNIYSPEFDHNLVKSLKNFNYPNEFDELKSVINDICENGKYSDENTYIELFFGDAREYLKTCEHKFDIIYQDAFSPSVNPSLWTLEYFHRLAELIKDDGVITTYSIALKIRLALYENGFKIYLNKNEGIRDSTVASKEEFEFFEKVDMKHKIACNENITVLSDNHLV